jgi:hypothetical protein
MPGTAARVSDGTLTACSAWFAAQMATGEVVSEPHYRCT